MNSRFKFRVWDKYTHETPAEQMQFLCFDGCLVDSDGCHHSPDDYIVEQCTGLKDKNGKLIYEGDILQIDCFDVKKGRYTRKAKVIYAVYDTKCEAGSCFELKTIDDNDDIRNLNMWHSKECTIIGNIHEQPEQKDVK